VDVERKLDRQARKCLDPVCRRLMVPSHFCTRALSTIRHNTLKGTPTQTSTPTTSLRKVSLRRSHSIHRIRAADNCDCPCGCFNIELGIIYHPPVHHILLKITGRARSTPSSINHAFLPELSSLGDEAEVVGDNQSHHAKQTVSQILTSQYFPPMVTLTRVEQCAHSTC
jgi:hypothetical protein